MWQGLPAAVAGWGLGEGPADASQAFRHVLGVLRSEAVIPPQLTRTEAMAYDQEQDKVRETAERFVNTLKPFRRMATRMRNSADPSWR